MLNSSRISDLLLEWWDIARADLPWRKTTDPYAIWVAEIMLQQTQINTVIPYYQRWMGHFPTVKALAAASLDDVLQLWQGLGYYSRARNLHAAAQEVVVRHNGRLPRTVPELMRLKGIGRYTAGAIASIAFDEKVPVLDGNVTRVLSRLSDLPDDVTRTATQKHLWKVAADLLPDERPGDFNQALMELGQQVCLVDKPQCLLCPLASFCLSRQRGTIMERPVRPARKRTPHYDVVAGIIWHQADPGREATSRFLIAQRPVNGMLGGLWEFPGGKQEAAESLPEALVREIYEELGIKIDVGPPLTTFKHAYTHFRITLHAFHASHVGGQPRNLGVADHAWVYLDQLREYAFANTDRQIIASLRSDLASETGSC